MSVKQVSCRLSRNMQEKTDVFVSSVSVKDFLTLEKHKFSIASAAVDGIDCIRCPKSTVSELYAGDFNTIVIPELAKLSPEIFGGSEVEQEKKAEGEPAAQS